MLLRASHHAELVLRDEIAELVSRRNGLLHALVGPREQVDLDAAVARLARGRDVYVCGPDGFTSAVAAAAQAAGVPAERIHHESFAF